VGPKNGLVSPSATLGSLSSVHLPEPSQPSLTTLLPHQSTSISQSWKAMKTKMPEMAMAHEKAAEVTKLY